MVQGIEEKKKKYIFKPLFNSLFITTKEQAIGNIKSNLKGIGLIDSSISAIDNYVYFASYLFNMVSKLPVISLV